MGYTKQGNWFLSQSVGLNPATAFGLQGTHFNQLPFIGNSSIYGGFGDVDGWNTQISDVWTIRPTIVNEIRMGYTKQGNWFLSQSVGLNPATAFGLQGTHFN